MLLVTSTDITVWIVSALLALGIGAGKYAKWKARNQLVRELAAMDRERREKVPQPDESSAGDGSAPGIDATI